ncbi:MAG: DNA-processing protein DprA [Gammaproteobacteria bacterium]
MSPSELRAWLALWHIKGIGSKTFFALLKHTGSLAELLQAPKAKLQGFKLPEEVLVALNNPAWQAADAQLRWAEQASHQIIDFYHPHYPKVLKHIHNPPPLLFVKGQPEALQSQQLAIVGSRSPTPTGLEIAFEFGGELAKAGLAVTSGLALGVDGAAHRGALRAGGKTLAVLGCGLDSLYPYQHKGLAEKIVEQGALISEFPLGVKPLAKHFPRRNRIVSGLSLGVLVVEAGLKSGSLITAQLALEQGREVFAIPGSIRNPQAKGCHYLIQQGAKLVETCADILLEMKDLAVSNHLPVSPSVKNSLAEPNALLLECIGYEATALDQIAIRSGFNVSTAAVQLLQLELQGRVVAVPGGYIRSGDS